jgi:sulfur carrier protein
MLLIINGNKEELRAAFLIDVIKFYGLQDKMVVVEAEGVIVPKELWESSPVSEGMKIELVHFVGGG